jgi:cytidylate kinase
VSRLVSERLGLRFINFTFRSLAAEKGLSLEAVLEKAAADDSWDREVDRRQLSLAREEGGCVLGSRLAIWMLEEADLKVYLRADPETRARRIAGREGTDLAAVAAFTAMRDSQDRERYLRLYGIDNDDCRLADLELNTGAFDPPGIADIIIAALAAKLRCIA